LVVAAVALTAAGSAFGASEQHPTRVHASKANSQTYTDPTGDSGNAPDVTNVTVSNDDNGQIKFAITLANRTALSSSDGLLINMDTNGNFSDGLGGADYGVVVASSGGALLSLAGGNPTPVTPTQPFATSFATGVVTASVNKADIGNPTQLTFYIAATGDSGATFGDFAPDTGGWTYQVTIAPPVPTVASFAPAGGSVGTTVE
jgi:hypothetical protein